MSKSGFLAINKVFSQNCPKKNGKFAQVFQKKSKKLNLLKKKRF